MFKLFSRNPKIIQLEYPLKGSFRYSIKKMIKFWKLPLSVDTTNRKLVCQRNRIRLFLVPFLKYLINFNLHSPMHTYLGNQFEMDRYFEQLSQRLFISSYSSKAYQINLTKLPKLFQVRILHTSLHYCQNGFTNRDKEYILFNLIKNSKVNLSD